MAARKPRSKRKPAEPKRKRRKSGGRKAGTPNKVTTEVKKALTEAFAELGGVPWLVEWGRDNPTEFLKLWAKMLPTEVKATGAFTLEVVEQIIEPGPANHVPPLPDPG